MTIWLVDDDPRTQESLTEFCRTQDLDLCIFAHGVGLQEAMEEPGPSPDLILLDDDVHGSSAWQVTQMLRRGFPGRMFIYCICCETNANFREVARRIGVDGWLERPVPTEVLQSLCDGIRDGSLKGHSMRQRIDFQVKMGRLSISYHRGVLTLAGNLHQHADLHRLVGLIPDDADEVIVDWARIGQVNLQGLRAWEHLMQSKVGQSRTFRFRRVPPSLLELHKLMPDVFGENVTIETVNLPISSREQIDLEHDLLESGSSFEAEPTSPLWKILKSDWHPSMPPPSGVPTSRQLVREPYTREIVYHPNLYELSEVAGPNASGSFALTYTRFLHSVLRLSLAEFFITRETLLDQVSRIAARFAGFRTSAETLGIEVDAEHARRGHLLDVVFGSYRPILHVLLASERITHALQLKAAFSPDASPHTFEERRLVLKGLVDRLCRPDFDKAYWAVIHSDVLNQERHYNKQPSEENLDNLAGSCLEVIAFLLEGLTKVVNDLGVQAMEMMEVLTSASEEVTTSRDKLIARSANTQDDGAFLNHALLSFEGPQSLALQIERSLHQCLNYQDDLDKLSQSLNVHDESNQILDHRRQDIRLLIGGASRAEVIESIRKNAVTFIEKRLAMHYFEELDGVFGECVETPTLTIFRSG